MLRDLLPIFAEMVEPVLRERSETHDEQLVRCMQTTNACVGKAHHETAVLIFGPSALTNTIRLDLGLALHKQSIREWALSTKTCVQVCG